VTVIAAGFDKLAAAPAVSPFESRLSRLLEEPETLAAAGGAGGIAAREEEELRRPSILVEDEDEIFHPAPETVSFDAEEDLDIPDFLKS
jgi:hypothetical protein